MHKQDAPPLNAARNALRHRTWQFVKGGLGHLQYLGRRAVGMDAKEEVVQSVIEMALAHGLVDDLMKEFKADADIIDLVNRLLLSDVIDTSQAVGYIKLLTIAGSSRIKSDINWAFDPRARLMGEDWKFWLAIALVVTIPYVAIFVVMEWWPSLAFLRLSDSILSARRHLVMSLKGDGMLEEYHLREIIRADLLIAQGSTAAEMSLETLVERYQERSALLRGTITIALIVIEEGERLGLTVARL
jgi:hypothetical protein